MEEKESNNIPHVLVFPFPIQGHMPPMLKFANLLSSSTDFYVTFVNTEYIHRRFFLHHFDRRPNFRFRTVPDGLALDDPRLFHQFLELEESLRTRSRVHYKELLVGPDPDGWPHVSCVMADAILGLAIEVAEEVGMPMMIFRTSSACSFWVFRCVGELINKGELPFPEDADLDEMVQGVEGMENFLRRRDLPSFCREAKSPSDLRLQLLTTITNNAGRGRALIMNTFSSLEAPTISHLRSFCPIIYTIGPIHMFAKTKNQETSASLWQEDRECIKWLDSQPPKSVVYVSFGSMAIMSRDDLIELWHGLIKSGHKFLWVLRQDLILGESRANVMALPPALERATKEKGCLVISWAPQEEVLSHPAIGCFLTHCGWNSTMESIVAGVPMIGLPFITDQFVNSRFVSEVWKIGLDMKDCCSRDSVERMLREAMEGDKAEELRRSIRDMAFEARRSVDEGGSSSLNFQNLIEHIRLLS